MLLIFNLGRLDIIPQNDLAIRKNYTGGYLYRRWDY